MLYSAKSWPSLLTGEYVIRLLNYRNFSWLFVGLSFYLGDISAEQPYLDQGIPNSDTLLGFLCLVRVAWLFDPFWFSWKFFLGFVINRIALVGCLLLQEKGERERLTAAVSSFKLLAATLLHAKAHLLEQSQSSEGGQAIYKPFAIVNLGSFSLHLSFVALRCILNGCFTCIKSWFVSVVGDGVEHQNLMPEYFDLQIGMELQCV